MVDGQLAGLMLSPTVLAQESVSDENIFSGERDFSAIDLTDKLDEANHCRHPKCSADGPDDSIGFLEYLNFAREQHGHGPLP
jgi:hypothetical protein